MEVMVGFHHGGAKRQRHIPITGSFLAPQQARGYKRSMSKATVLRPTPPASVKAIIPLIFAVLLGCLGLGWGTVASAQTSPWAQGDKSRARLLAAGGPTEGRFLAGVEIRLAPHNLTYWKLPGDAGVPPVFSFEGSKNLKSVQPLYPAPRRFPEAGGEAFGYMDEVLFPLWITPTDPTKPVSVALKLDYATCDKICIPARAELSLDLAPGAGRSEDSALLQAWMGRIPRPPGDPAAPRPSLSPGEKPGAWRVRFTGQAPSDLFAEGPDDWFFDTKPNGDGFDLILVQKPANAPAGTVELVLTMVSGDRAFEARTPLDVGLPKP